MRDLQRRRLRPAKDGYRRRGGRSRKKQGNNQRKLLIVLTVWSLSTGIHGGVTSA